MWACGSDRPSAGRGRTPGSGAQPRQLTDYLEDILPRIGNGAHEVRNWVVAHGAAGGRGFDLIDYEPVPEVYVGCGYAAWNVEGRKEAA